MTETVGSEIIEHLRHIRGHVDQIADDVVGLKQLMSRLQSGMTFARSEPFNATSGRNSASCATPHSPEDRG